MIVGAISLHSPPPLLFIPAYLLAVVAALLALKIVRSSPNLQPAYRCIIQSQIFSNLTGVALLVSANVTSSSFSNNELFYIEIVTDSLFHFASLCYVIVAVHRFVVIGQEYSERKWTDSVPVVILCTALFAIIKTTLFKLYHESMSNDTHGHRHILTTLLFLGCPLIQVLVILSLDSISFKHLRFYNAQISDRIASNKNVEWRLLSQSICSCVPNFLFIIMIVLMPNLDSYNELVRSLATVGLQLFDVVVDSMVIIVYSKPYGYFRTRTSDSLSVDSDSREESQF